MSSKKLGHPGGIAWAAARNGSEVDSSGSRVLRSCSSSRRTILTPPRREKISSLGSIRLVSPARDCSVNCLICDQIGASASAEEYDMA